MNAPGGGSGGRSTTGNGGAPGGTGGSSTSGSGTGGSSAGTGGAGTGGASTGGSGGSASGGGGSSAGEGGSSAGEGGSSAGEGGSATGGQGGNGGANGAAGTGGSGGTNGSGGSGGSGGTNGSGGGGTGGTNGTGGGGTGGGGSGGGGTPVLDVERYELKGAFNWATESLEAEVTITLAPAAIGLASAALDIDRPKLTVKSVRTPTGAALPFSTTNSKLNVNLAGQFPPGQPPVMVVAYDAVATGDALAAVPAKTGGPSDARVAFTQSEPLGVDQWMPCHNDPADRAYFAADMVVPSGEMLIANGDLVADEPAGAGRRMAYATSYTLPTYLMAFATGGFAVESAVGPHGLPLAIWHRQGAGGDYAAMLFELGRLVTHFESLLGVPYPFEKYAVVSLPQFSAGGIEHAGITFQRESVSTNPASTSSDLATTAHELGHQWFGDMVTVLTWDDLWIKEGMATVLQSEGTRAYLDESGSGTLNGDNFSATDGQAIRDVALPPEQKYTSGPYGRAAWLLTQIRTLVGEQAFWGALKRVLTKHAYGNVGTDEFLEEFRADLGEAAYAKAKSAVDAKDVYAVQVLPPASPGGPPRATVIDAEGSLVAPMRAEWRRDDGTVDALTLAPGQQVELVREAPGDLLVLDPADAHIDWPLSSSSSNNFEIHVAPMLRPSTASALARFVALPGAHQYASLSYDWAPEPPAGFAGFLAALDSEHAAATALTAACERATQPGPSAAAWRTAVTGVIGSMPGYRGSSALPREACAEAADVASIFAAEWAKMAANPLDPSVPEGHLVYLAPLWAGLPPALARGSFGAIAYGGRSAHERGLAATTLRSFVLAFSGQLTGAERTAWRAMATPIVAESRLVEVLPAMFTVIGNVGGAATENAAARAAIAQVLHDSVRADLNLVRPVCAARKLSSGDLSAWNAFVASLQDIGDPNLQSAIQSVSQNPANACAPYFGGVSLAPPPDSALARKLSAEQLEGKARR